MSTCHEESIISTNLPAGSCRRGKCNQLDFDGLLRGDLQQCRFLRLLESIHQASTFAWEARRGRRARWPMSAPAVSPATRTGMVMTTWTTRIAELPSEVQSSVVCPGRMTPAESGRKRRRGRHEPSVGRCLEGLCVRCVSEYWWESERIASSMSFPWCSCWCK